MAETGMDAAEYLGLLRTRAMQMLDQVPRGSSYPRSLAAATGLIAERLIAEDPAAAELASMCAFLAPEPIPEDLFTNAVSELPAGLAARAADPLAWRQTLARLTRHSLARIDHRGLQMHRLTQAILRDRLTPEQAAIIRTRTEAIPAASNPGDANDPSAWPAWAQLLPHLLALDPATTTSAELRDLAHGALWYLIKRGDARTSRDLAENLYQHWRGTLGPDHHHTLAAATTLAVALYQVGRYSEARDLDEGTLTRLRSAHGDDHRLTLVSATHFILRLCSLGEFQVARGLGENTLARCRRVLGEDHPDTLLSADNVSGAASNVSLRTYDWSRQRSAM